MRPQLYLYERPSNPEAIRHSVACLEKAIRRCPVPGHQEIQGKQVCFHVQDVPVPLEALPEGASAVPVQERRYAVGDGKAPPGGCEARGEVQGPSPDVESGVPASLGDMDHPHIAAVGHRPYIDRRAMDP